ncbi:MAG: DNA internalization-related competence protein ComEC/Rec2 [Gammaproteobacteria bacterium]
MIAGMLCAAAGIALVVCLPALPPVWVVPVLATVLLPLAMGPLRGLRLAAALLAGVLYGIASAHHLLWRALPPALEGERRVVPLCIVDLPVKRSERGREQWRLRARLLAPVAWSGGLWRGREIELTWYAAGDFRPGEAWAMPLVLRAPRGFLNPGSRDHQAWLHAEGIDATAYVADPLAARRAGACEAGADGLRSRIRERLDALFAGHPQLAALRALTIGDGSGFGPGDWALFARTGTTHLVVISGMHLSLVAAMVFGAASRLARCFPAALARLPARHWGSLVSLPAVLGYAALAGGGVSVQRAAIMATAMLAVLLAERSAAAWRAFAIALLLVTVLQPLAVTQPGFWLSFLAVAALFAGFGARLEAPGWREALWKPQWLVGLALVVPLALLGLPQAPLGPAVNLLAIPVVDLLVVPASLLGVLLLAMSEPVAVVVLGFALRVLEYLHAGLTFAAAYAPPPRGPVDTPAWQMALACTGALCLLAPRGFGLRWLGALMFLPWVLGKAAEPPPLLRLLQLDVGQGTALVLRTRGHTLVYDTGPRYSERFDAGRALVVPALDWIGSTGVDLVVLSHSDNDHAGGFAGLVSSRPLQRVIGGEPLPSGFPLGRCVRGLRWRWDGVEFRVLHPPAARAAWRDNEASCVLRVEAAGRVILLTGDIEQAAEAALLAAGRPALAANIATVPHHGSRSSSTPAFVRAVGARWALVSAGYRNRFGHPRPEVLARWRTAGSRVLDSAASGAILFEVQADGLIREPERWRERERRWWHRGD